MEATQDVPYSRSSPMMPQMASYMEQDPMLAGCQSLYSWLPSSSRSYSRPARSLKPPSCLIVELVAIDWQCLVLL